jgi:hypothetical protein
MKTSRLFLPLFLLLALLFAQQGAVTHGIAHVMAEQSQDQSLPHEGHCDFCDAYDQIGSMVGSSIAGFTPLLDFDSPTTEHIYTFTSVASFSFAARAPPYPA